MACLLPDGPVTHGEPKKPVFKKRQVSAPKTPGVRQTKSIRRGSSTTPRTRRILGRGGVRYRLHREFNARSKAYKKVSRNSTRHQGVAHVYIIRHPNGSIYKVGMSTGGVRKGDKKSIRAENQARYQTRLYQAAGGKGKFTTKILRKFPGVDYARAYETGFRDTFRRQFGTGIKDYKTLPGNKEHLRGKRK